MADPSKWGGGIEIKIFTEILKLEIAIVDVQTNRIDIFGQDKNYTSRIYLLYNGIHYDPLVLNFDESSEPDTDITIFDSEDDSIANKFKILIKDIQQKGDFVAANNSYREMLNQNPADQVALAGLAQVGLLERASKLNPNDVLQKASDRKDFASQMDLADLELMKGNPGAGFAVLISAIKISSGEDRDKLRARLLELFIVVGDSDPEVIKARRDLASALF